MSHRNITNRGNGPIKTSLAVAVAGAGLALVLAGCASGASTTPTASGNVPEGADPAIYNSLPDENKESGKLSIATDPTYGPPCEFYENSSSTEMIGFEVDLWNAIAEKMGLTPEPEALAFDSLIPSVESGRYDMAMECLTDNPEREKSGDFVDMFYSEIGFLASAENPKDVSEDPESLCGLNIATVTGTDVATYVPNIIEPLCLDAGLPAPTATEFPASAQVLLAIDSGRVDATLKSVSQSQYMITKTDAPYVIFETDVLPKKYSGPIFNKENTALSAAWLAGVKAIHEDGQYDAILDEWGISGLALDEPGINLATENPLPTATPAP
jgi:polar amino acid transport system substrate-binding protein